MRKFFAVYVLAVLTLFLGFLALPAMSSAEEPTTEPSTVHDSWGGVRARYADDGTPILESKSAQTDAAAFEPEPTDWTIFTAAQEVMKAYKVSPFAITAVQAVVPINPDGSRGDSTEVVITSTGTDYFYVPSTGTVTSAPPKEFLTGQAMFYGTSIDRYQGWHCGNVEYAVTFNFPWCLHETDTQRGVFGGTPGIVDAWAMGSPPCWPFVCGTPLPPTIAWLGSGTEGWWNYRYCPGDRNSNVIGRTVQKRWYYGWKNCGWSDLAIARSVSALVRY